MLQVLQSSFVFLFSSLFVSSGLILILYMVTLLQGLHEVFTFDSTFVLDVQPNPSTLLSWLHKLAAHREPKSNAGEAGDNHDAIRLISNSSYLTELNLALSVLLCFRQISERG